MPIKLPNRYASFDDIFISPQFSASSSRSDIDITSRIGPLILKTPVISANMPAITGVDMAAEMHEYGGLGILPRFNSDEDAVDDYKRASALTGGNVGVSIGVQQHDIIRFAKLYDAGARLFCIDVAHGHHAMVRDMIKLIRFRYGYFKDVLWSGKNPSSAPVIIAGNVATPQGVMDLVDWGCDIIKLGIGPGSACLTRKNTGVGIPQFSALEEVGRFYASRGMPVPPIIADGGIKNRGDIPKALIFARAVMVAKLIAGTMETPGAVYEDDDSHLYKKFGGSASGEHKVSCGKSNRFVEGNMMNVIFDGKVKYIILKIRDSIQTAFSYSGATNMDEYQKRVVYGEMTTGGSMESKLLK